MPALPLAALLRLLIIWLAIILAETVQGALRTWLLSSQVEFVGRQISVITGAAVIFAITWMSLRWIRIRTAGGALVAGVVWVALTIPFEIAVGRVLGFSWARILSDYDLTQGGLMPLGLIAMALTPWLVHKLQARRARDLHQSATQSHEASLRPRDSP